MFVRRFVPPLLGVDYPNSSQVVDDGMPLKLMVLFKFFERRQREILARESFPFLCVVAVGQKQRAADSLFREGISEGKFYDGNVRYVGNCRGRSSVEC